MGLTRLRAEQISDIDYKQAVRVITVTDITTLSGGAPSQVDGVNLSVGDRILVTAQDPGSENGIYQVQTVGTGSNGTWIRSIDTNQTGELEAGTIVMVTEGNTYADTQWKLTTNNPIIIGTTPLTFEQNSAYAFGNIVANTTAVLANSVGSTVTFTPGAGIAITGNNTTKTVTITATGSAETTAISNGTSNVSVVSLGGNVAVGIGGTSNVAVFSTANIVTAANLLPSANVTYSLGSTNSRWKDLWIANSSIYIGDVTIAAVGPSLTINGANVLTGNAGANLSTTGNVIGGNILTSGLVSATGNITGNFIIGNGSQLTGLPAGYANSNAAAYFSSGTVSTNILTTAAISATGNVTGGNVLTGGLISATGNVFGGNALFSGNLTVNGNVTYINSNVVTINDLAINLANNAANVAQVNNGGIELGPQGSPFVTFLYNNSANTWTSSVGLSAVGNIAGGNLSGTNISGTLTTASQTNITAVGTLTSLNSGAISSSGNVTGANFLTAGLVSATGNVDAGNVKTAGLISATGAVTGSQFNGSGAGLTGIPNSALSNSAVTVNGTSISLGGSGTVTANAATLTGTTLNSTVVSSSLTSVGTLGSLAVTGNITSGNISGTRGAFTNVAGTLETAAQNNITSVGTLSSLSVTGNVQGGNIRTAGIVSATGNITGNFFIGNGSALTGIVAGLIWTTQANTAPSSPKPGDFWYDSFNDKKYQYTNDGTSNVWIDQSFPTTFSTITTQNIVNGGANGTGNIGTSVGYFNTAFVKATSAQYADLAEIYETDEDYKPGTVVVFGGVKEITVTTQSHDTRVAGVISTAPAFIMNATSKGLPVAFTGRVPCRVRGPVQKGDVLVTSTTSGVAEKITQQYQPGCVLGKSLGEINDNSIQTIEVVVGRF